MEDLKFLHNNYAGNEIANQENLDRDELEDFGLNPKIVIVEDDRILGLSIKKYLMKSWDKLLFWSKYINNPIKKDPKTFTTRVPTNE